MALSDEYEDIVERYNERRKLRNMVARYRQRREGRLAARREEREDERWITVGAQAPDKETGEPGRKGKHVLIDDEGKVVSGAGGSLAGKVFKGAKSSSGEVKVDPKKVAPPKEGGEAAGVEKKPVEPKVEPPKAKRFGEWDENAEAKKIVNEEVASVKAVEGESYFDTAKKRKIIRDAIEKLPAGTVIKSGDSMYYKAGEHGWNQVYANGSIGKSYDYDDSFYKNGAEYVGNFDTDKTMLPGASVSFEAKGNLAEHFKEKFERKQSEMKANGDGTFAAYSAADKFLAACPDGTVIDIDGGGWMKKDAGKWKLKPAKGPAKNVKYPASTLNELLNGGKVKTISAEVEAYESKGEGDYKVSLGNTFVSKFGKDEYTGMHDIVLNSKAEKQKSVWVQFENQMKVEKNPDDVSYSPGTASFRVYDTLEGPKHRSRYDAPFHEGGHCIDYWAGRAYQQITGSTSYGPLSRIYENGKLNKKMMEEWKVARDKLIADYNAAAGPKLSALQSKLEDEIKKYGSLTSATITKLYFDDQISYDSYHKCKENPGLFKMSMVSAGGKDCRGMLEAVTGRKFDVWGDVLDMFGMASRGAFGGAHKISYMKSGHDATTEFFAEAFGTTMREGSVKTAEESVKLIKRYFPESFAIFGEMMEWLDKNKEKVRMG